MRQVWYICPAVCFVSPTSRPQLLEKDTVFAWVVRERAIHVVYEVCQSLYMHVQMNLGNTLMRYFPFRHTCARWQFSSEFTTVRHSTAKS